jgi:hypothetical protein
MEYSKLLQSLRDKDLESESSKQKQEQLDKSLKEAIADKMKSLIQ